MQNSEKFLGIFAAVERGLRQAAGADRSTSFYQLVDRASAHNRAAYRFRDDLKEFADLRNAIVHERADGHVIAEPNDRAVAEFERLRSLLLNPPMVLSKFQVSVCTRGSSESVGAAVTDMCAGKFSQIPVLAEGSVTAVLTAETVTRWLASEAPNDIVSLWDTRISDVLPYTEDIDHYSFLPRRATLIDALSLFEEFAARGKKLDALMITHDGRPDQSLLGLLTISDLPGVLSALGLKRVSIM